MFELIWLPVSPQKQLTAFLWPTVYTNKVLCSCVSLSKNNSQLAPPNRKAFRSLTQLAVVDGEPLQLSSPPFRRAAFVSPSSACQNLKDSDILNTFLFVRGVGWLPAFRMFESNYSLHNSSTIPLLHMNCLTFKLFIRMVPRYAECGAIERTVMIMRLKIAGWQDNLLHRGYW